MILYGDKKNELIGRRELNCALEVFEKIISDEEELFMKKTFNQIDEMNIAIHFKNQQQLEKLVDYLKAYGYDYGTGNNNILEIKGLGVRYFSENNQYLSLDRSQKYHPRNYVSCGKGYKDVVYEFNEINWNIC